jgi:hypothetical protein
MLKKVRKIKWMYMKIFVLTSCVASKKYSISDIKEVLDKHNLPIPTDNLENEQKYKEVLKDFILPASQCMKDHLSI